MQRGQTSTEYLLITAGAILIAVIVGYYIATYGTQASQHQQKEAEHILPKDTLPPTTILICNSSSCFTEYNTDVKISFACQDNLGGTGCKETNYSVTCSGSCPTPGTGGWKTCPQPAGCKDVFVLKKPSSGRAIYSVRFYSVDAKKNKENVRKVIITVQ
jgi:hypothetical protein